MLDKKPYSIDALYRTGGLPVTVLHVLLERLMKNWLADRDAGRLSPRPRHRSFLVAYHKSFQVKNRLTATSSHGKALCLLKTQFAKKPKNPV